MSDSNDLKAPSAQLSLTVGPTLSAPSTPSSPSPLFAPLAFSALPDRSGSPGSAAPSESEEFQQSAPPERLLAVDMGLRAGLALFGRDGKLIWYRSRNYGNRSRLKKAVYSVLNEASPLSVVALEGGGQHATPWIQ